MMKRFAKDFLLWTLLFSLVLSLTACGKKGPTTESSPTPDPVESVEPYS